MQKVVVPRGPFVFRTGLDDGKVNPHCFNFGVRHSDVPEQIRPPLLKIFEELAVVDKLHLVRVGITNADVGDKRDRRITHSTHP